MTTLALRTNYTDTEIISTNTFDFDIEKTMKEYEGYLMQRQTNSYSTLNTYINSARYFMNWLKDNNIVYVNDEELQKYKQHLESHYDENKKQFVSYKNNTINTFIIGLKTFYRFLEKKKGFINNARELKNKRITRTTHQRGALTIEQVRELYDAIDTSTLEGKRANAIIHLLITSGLRECEIVRANISDMQNEGGNRILKVQGKGRDDKDEFVLLTSSTQKAINDYLSARGKFEIDEPLFASISNRNKSARLQTRTIRNIVKNLFHKIGIYDENITTHSLRHTCITLAIISGKTLPEVQQLARHQNINTTMIYQHAYNKINSNCEGAIESLIEGNTIYE